MSIPQQADSTREYREDIRTRSCTMRDVVVLTVAGRLLLWHSVYLAVPRKHQLTVALLKK
jgi:hypothetical protein